MVIDNEKCIGCGLCVDDCVNGYLKLSDGRAAAGRGVCILCGHCQAICPQGAIQLAETDADAVLEYNEKDFSIDANQLLRFMKYRRSMRHFTGEAVSAEMLEQILEAGRMAPTAANTQAIRYIVLEERAGELAEKAMFALNDAANRMREDKSLAVHRPYRMKWRNMYKEYTENGKDGIFYHAPSVIVVVDTAASSGENLINCGIASDNMELMANALGLGVCYSGFFLTACEIDTELSSELGIKEGEAIASVLAIGHPAVHYQRTVGRKKIDVTRL